MGILESKALALGVFPDEHYIRVSGNPLRAMNETNIQLAMVLILQEQKIYETD